MPQLGMALPCHLLTDQMSGARLQHMASGHQCLDGGIWLCVGVRLHAGGGALQQDLPELRLACQGCQQSWAVASTQQRMQPHPERRFWLSKWRAARQPLRLCIKALEEQCADLRYCSNVLLIEAHLCTALAFIRHSFIWAYRHAGAQEQRMSTCLSQRVAAAACAL